MKKIELLEIFTRQQRIEVDYPDILREVDGPVIRHVNLSDDRGFVIYSHLDEETVEAAISAQIERFQAVPQSFEWKAYDYDSPVDLVERLRRRGFEIGEPEALLILDLTNNPGALDRSVPSSVVRITDPNGIDQIVKLEDTVWGTDHQHLGEFLKRELRQRPDTLSVFLSYQGQQPASAAWVFYHPGSSFASLWGGSTLEQFRNRGHYSHLLAARAQEAFSRGFTLLTVDASPMSRPILEKHGFQYIAMSTPCMWKIKKK